MELVKDAVIFMVSLKSDNSSSGGYLKKTYSVKSDIMVDFLATLPQITVIGFDDKTHPSDDGTTVTTKQYAVLHRYDVNGCCGMLTKISVTAKGETPSVRYKLIVTDSEFSRSLIMMLKNIYSKEDHSCNYARNYKFTSFEFEECVIVTEPSDVGQGELFETKGIPEWDRGTRRIIDLGEHRDGYEYLTSMICEFNLTILKIGDTQKVVKQSPDPKTTKNGTIAFFDTFNMTGTRVFSFRITKFEGEFNEHVVMHELEHPDAYSQSVTRLIRERHERSAR